MTHPTHNRMTPTALAVLLSCCGAALAQTAPAGQVQEIVVTAQKRSTLASKTPAALTVLAGDDLKAEGAADTRRLADLVPNVLIGTGGIGATEIAIRGIGSTNNTEVGDPAVGVSIDGVYLGRPQMAGATLFDLERVEVLRGPQGTLYGRNTTAGAINIITKKPGGKFEALIDAGLSSYGGKQAEAMVNVPVAKGFALRGVVSRAKRDGTIDTAHAPANTYTRDRSDVDNTSARLHGLWTVNKDTSLLVTGYYTLNKGVGPGSVDYDVVAANPKGSAGRYVPTSRYEGLLRDETKGLTGEFKTATPLGDVTVLANHHAQDRDNVFTVSTRPAGFWSFSRFAQNSVEARLASSDQGPLQYVAGLYAFREEGSPIVLGAIGAQTLFYQDSLVANSKAAFGQLGYTVAPGMRLSAGVRSTQDDKTRTGCSYSFTALNTAGLGAYTNPDNLPGGYPAKSSLPPCTGGAVNAAAVSYSQATYKLGFDWEPRPNELFFVSASTGFKAGGFNDGNPGSRGDALTYKPENITALELGWKGRYLNQSLQLAASLFSYQYTDLQVSAVAACPTGTCQVTQNAAKAQSQGLELEARWQLTPADRLNFALTYTDATYKQFAAAVTTANPAGINWSGQTLDKAPKTTVSLGYTHRWSLASGAGLALYAGTKHSGSYLLSNPAAATRFTQTSFFKSDAHLTYSSADDRYDIQLYARNIENRNVMVTYQFSGGRNGVYLADPRMVGLRGTLRF